MSFPSQCLPRLPLMLSLLLGSMVLAHAVVAQDGIDDIFDTPTPKPSTPAEADTDAPSPPAATEAAVPLGGDRSRMGFTQENVAAQMAELEERMFRLSEALLNLEPENASRLRLALKFSREELILQQMRDTQALLEEAQLGKAETEVRQLLAKLEHLRNLLLAEDLDFELKLARLRQMRETLAQLERIIKEEQRELAWSRSAIETQEELDRLRSRREDLESIIRDQNAVLETTTNGKDAATPKDRAEAVSGAIAREAGVRETAATLAADPLFAEREPAWLKQAIPHVDDTTTHLEADSLDPALNSGQQALDLFLKERDRLDERIAEAEAAISEDQFRQFERDQNRNRDATDALSRVSSRLGDAGVSLQKNLIDASGAMRDAEGNLAQTEPEPAANDQLDALKKLLESRETLAGAMEDLLVELRTELQAQILADLTEMYEAQVAIRESTEAQAPRAAEQSRTALIALAGLAKSEAELAARIEQLTDLVEITEFGIALPTSLRVLGREMLAVEALLKAGDATQPTIALERRIEEDLLGLIQAMRRLPPSTPPPPGTPLPTNPRDRERELNRLVAELKMIRMLQTRLNDDTVIVDETRPDDTPLSAELRRAIDALRNNQDEIRASLSKIGRQLEPPGLGGEVDL
ncbi:coiled-coil domain-containing protein [Tautonia rosea]|uniref:DUF4175 domain-containing protein n=1 Tax=Tautonia rosea TaxID=2728037 RepID=UPI00147676B0|nr:DUF4175 domain-containing protein [Tautonia rosea]